MRLVITEHAAKSMNERIRCSPEKQMKLATKAWNSKETVIDSEVANAKFYREKNRKVLFKKLMGMVYIFEKRQDTAILITVYSPVNLLSRKRKPARDRLAANSTLPRSRFSLYAIK